MVYGQNPYCFPQGGAVPDQLTAYKQPYQPVYPPQMMSQTQPQPQGNGMLWVQGEAAAKSWAVAPGASVVLWDSEKKFIYFKYADTSGVPSMIKIKWDYCQPETEQQDAGTPTGDFAPMGTVRALEDKIKALEERIEAIHKAEEAQA